jgi:hypothetical protein
MAYLPKSKPPRPNYTSQLPAWKAGGAMQGRGTVQRPSALGKPQLSRDVPGFGRFNP